MQENTVILNARVARALIRAMGYQAENLQRQHRGESMAYMEKDFSDLIELEDIGHNDVISLLSGA